MDLTAEQFDQIVASLRSDGPGARSSEKREFPRVGMRVQIDIIVSDKPPKRHRVWLRDFSTTGIGFVHTQALKQGSALIVSLRKGRHDTLKLLYQVVRIVRIDDNQFIIGARLERTLDDAAAVVSGTQTPQAAQKTN